MIDAGCLDRPRSGKALSGETQIRRAVRWGRRESAVALDPQEVRPSERTDRVRHDVVLRGIALVYRQTCMRVRVAGTTMA